MTNPPSVLAALAPVRSLLVAIFILMFGSGFLAPLLTLRLEPTTGTIGIGIVATAYFVGLVAGALRAGALVERVGHIRAFSAFVAIFSASILAYSLYQNAIFWLLLRLVDGVAMAGVFVCLESWLNERASPGTRGGVLAAYMVALYTGQALGQLLLGWIGRAAFLPFVVASILVTLAILPICLTRSIEPGAVRARAFSLASLLRASPLGVIGATTAGMMVGAFYGMAAIYASRLGFRLQGIAAFMMVVLLGGVLLQWPLGRLSDHFDRRLVIVLSFVATAAVSGALALVGTLPVAVFLLGALFGGLSFAVYPLCVAHSNDRLVEAERVAASGRLVLLYAIGSAVGPVGAAIAMHWVGPAGLFWFTAFSALLTVGLGFWRQATQAPVPEDVQQDFQIVPRTTPVASLLDPNTPDAAPLPEPPA